MTAEFDQLVAEFEAFQARIQNVDDRFERLADMQGELESLEVSATSADRSVTVVAGPGGSVRDIRLTEEALQVGAHRLGSLIMSTLREAVADAARQQADIVQEYAGDGAPVLDQVLETQSEVTGVPVEELREQTRRRSSDGDAYLRDLSDDEED